MKEKSINENIIIIIPSVKQKNIYFCNFDLKIIYKCLKKKSRFTDLKHAISLFQCSIYPIGDMLGE